MSRIPRRLLIVKRDPPDVGWNIMLEIDGEKTLSRQVPDSVGEKAMLAAQDAVVAVLTSTTGDIPRVNPRRTR